MNNRLKVALTHDVDRTKKTYQHFTHFFKALGKLDFKDALYQITSFNEDMQVYWSFDEILEIENKFNVKSTFFFLIESIPFNLFRISNWKLSLGRFDINEPRIISMINYLDENGWEVGLHGSYRSFNDFNLLNKEKSILENILKHPVIGIRQHYLNLNENTWAFQKQTGFLYDSSWGYNRKIGFKDNRVRPFKPFSDNFVVFPLAVMDFCYMNTPDRKKVLMEIIKKCKEENGILVVNWHSNNFDEHDYPDFSKAYKEVIQTCISEDAVFNTLSFFYQNDKI
ncbi:MAG TPA: polysaccharide deacetylase family protein [Ignavibacteriaceae bacterium]|nr:polysaccharide deacetylase family protein [Ignavibacteriaceae bacterium]